MKDHHRQRIDRALNYPYRWDGNSYMFSGASLKRVTDPIDPALVKGRSPMLAIGSNRSPEQLARKFADWPEPLAIPVTACWVVDVDVVFAAHVAGYGAIPATLYPSFGTRVRLAVTWLTPSERAHMDKTEGLGVRYRYLRLSTEQVAVDRLDCRPAVDVYVATNGAMAADGEPVALAAVRAENRQFQERSQLEIQAWLATELGHQGTVAALVDRHVSDPAARQRTIDHLSRTARHIS